MALDTVKSCVERAYDTPSIANVSKDEEAGAGYIKVVKMMLTKMNMLLNLKEGFKSEQINVIPSLLLSDYGHLRLNDINMVCRGIVTGKYKIYERIDTQVFFNCVAQYDSSDERISAREEYNTKNHISKSKAAEQLKEMPQEFLDAFKKKKTTEPVVRIADVMPAFKVTDKDSMKKLKGDGKE